MLVKRCVHFVDNLLIRLTRVDPLDRISEFANTEFRSFPYFIYFLYRSTLSYYRY